MGTVDAVIVGSGPNGLAAAVTLARAGLSVEVFEAADTIGGGTRTAELTVPGFQHDVCSAVHPQALASPFFQAFELAKRIEFVVPDLSYAHPLPDGSAGLAYRDLDRTVDELGTDGARWRRLLEPLLNRLDGVTDFTGGQLLRIPKDPVAVLRFGLRVLGEGTLAWNRGWAGERAQAMLSGVMAHAGVRMPSFGAAGTGLLLAAHAHAAGWPIPLGGSQAIADALAADVLAHGGRIVLGTRVRDLRELPDARAVIFDTSPRELLQIVGSRAPEKYRARLSRFRYGNAVAKVDFALAEAVPWANGALADAGTVHLGGTREQIAAAESAVARGRHPKSPYVLLSQPSRFDPTRAPEGQHVLWAYTHVPRGSRLDATESVTAQIETVAPGFRGVIIASAAQSAVEVEQYNPNNVGGNITGGTVDVAQLIRRPVISQTPWTTPIPGVFLCSASTPPGPAVHGMGGWFAAREALEGRFGIQTLPSLGVTTHTRPADG